MIDIDYLTKLLGLAKLNGLSHLKMVGLELRFQAVYPQNNSLNHEALGPHPANIDETHLPVDLRTDAINDFDKILNWSGSPDPNETETHGTNDLPLTMGSP